MEKRSESNKFVAVIDKWASLVASLQCRRTKFDPWVGNTRWRRDWLPTPVLGCQIIGLQANRRKTIHDEESKKKFEKFRERSRAWRQATTNPSLLSIYIVASLGHLTYGIEHYVVFCDCLPFLSVVWLNFTHVVTWAEFRLFYSHIHCVNILFYSYIHQMIYIWFVSIVVLL